MAEDDQKKISVVGMALCSLNQVVRLEIGDDFIYSNKTITVKLDELEEFETVDSLPDKLLTNNGIGELIDVCAQLPASLLLAAEYGLDRESIYSAYVALAKYAEKNPAVDPRLPAASLLFGHVFEHLLRHGFLEGVIAEVLDDFAVVATKRLVIRQKATGIKTGEYDIELPSAALLGTDDYTASHNEISAMMTRGELAAAEDRVLELCADAEERFGMPHPASLVILGQLRLATRRYRNASQTLRWAYDVIFGVLEDAIEYRWVPILLSCGTSLAEALRELGSLDGALRQIQKTIGHYRDFTVGIKYELPENIRNVALSHQLSSEINAVYIAAKLYRLMGDRKCAEMLASGAMLRSWSLFGDNHGAARLQLLVARYAAERGDLEQALGHFENASKHTEIEPAERILWISLLSKHGQFDQARTALEEVLSTGALGEDLNLYANASTIFAEIEEHDGNFREGCRHRYNAHQYSDQLLEITSSFLSTKELQATAQRHLVYLYMFANAAADRFVDDAEIVERLYESVARRKFFATDVQRHIRRSTINDPKYAESWQTLHNLRSVAGAARLLDHNALEFDPQLNDIFRRIDDIEAHLAEAAGGLKLPEFDIAELLAALPPNACLVEFLYVAGLVPDAEFHDPTKPRYIIFVLKAEGVYMLDLGDAFVIDDAVRTYLRRIDAGVRNLDRYAQALVDKIWGPVASLISGLTDIIIVPDGELVRLPFATLKHDGSYIADQVSISYASTGRDLFRFAKGRCIGGSEPAIFADPDFDRGLIMHPEFGWERLEGARKEGERIADMLGVAPYLGADASEENLKALKSPALLHLATHGYFQDSRATSKADFKDLKPNQVRRFALAGGGIVLAGANALFGTRDDTARTADDGLLNELDILTLDLANTELVVLSACDTGHGTVQVGEGVMGMARAFVVAGADSIIMSLWKVPDNVTMSMMTFFYEQLLGGASRHAALQAAQNAIRKDYPEVANWGAFVCYGSAGPIRSKLNVNTAN